VFENRVLRRLFGPKRNEVIGEWRKLRIQELRVFYSLPSIVWMVKLRRMRWVGHVACMRERRGCTGFYWGNLMERGHRGGPDVDVRTILRWIFMKWERVETGWNWLRIGTGGRHL